MGLIRSALALVLLLHVSSLGGCVKGDTSSTTEADPQDPSTVNKGPPDESSGPKEPILDRKEKDQKDGKEVKEEEVKPSDVPAAISSDSGPPPVVNPLEGAEIRQSADQSGSRLYSVSDVAPDPVKDLSTASEKDEKAAEKEEEKAAEEDVDKVVPAENANVQSHDPSKTVDETKEKSTGVLGGQSPDEQNKIAVVQADTEPTIRGEPGAPEGPAVHTTPTDDGGIQASTVSDTGVGQPLATGERGTRGVLPGALPPPPIVKTVHTPAPGVDVKVGGDTHVTHTDPEIAKQTSVADSSSPAVIPLVAASNPSGAGNAQGNPVIGNKGERDPTKVVASDHVKGVRSLTGENTQKEKVTIADASEVKTVVSTGNGGKTEVKSEVGITDKNTKNKPGKNENSPEEVAAKETKEQTKEKLPKTAGKTGEKVEDTKKKPVISGGGIGTVTKSVPPKADATPDKGDKTTTMVKVLPKVSITVPPIPGVNKTTTLSATAISSTIPAVLITSVVFLYLYNW